MKTLEAWGNWCRANNVRITHRKNAEAAFAVFLIQQKEIDRLSAELVKTRKELEAIAECM